MFAGVFVLESLCPQPRPLPSVPGPQHWGLLQALLFPACSIPRNIPAGRAAFGAAEGLECAPVRLQSHGS